MQLNKSNLDKISTDAVELPKLESFGFEEKVLQFGTGVLLRGLPDYFINRANQQNLFHGRIVVVKSTNSGGGSDAFGDQDGLYTICIKGIEHGEEVIKNEVSNSISRVLAANNQWAEVLEVARNPSLKIVISNTTEVGIVESDDRIDDNPPTSFPGKLLSVLYERFKTLGGSDDTGLVILPTELITDNGTKLKSIILDLSKRNHLEPEFIAWLDNSNEFCNTLVDRIVPGALPNSEQSALEKALGFQDKLTIMVEPFTLWAIESNSEKVKETISFSAVDDGIKIVPSIDKFKELKLRLLNATHTLSCAAAILAGFSTVKEAMQNTTFREFVESLMKEEIGKAIEGGDISADEIIQFSNSVLDRFSNPFLEHKWESIALNYTAKLDMRVATFLEKYAHDDRAELDRMALGIASYLLLVKAISQGGDSGVVINGNQLNIKDDQAEKVAQYWKNPSTLVNDVFADKSIWGEKLSRRDRFAEKVDFFVGKIQQLGVIEVMKTL